jgi:CRISPR-associated protein Csd1
VHKRTHKYGVRVGTGVAVYWSNQNPEFVDAFADLQDSHDPDEVGRLLTAPYRGRAPGTDSSDFNCVILTANSGRVVVHQEISTTVGIVQTNLQQYFSDLHFGPDAHTYSMYALCKSLAFPGEHSYAPATMTKALLLAALLGNPFPRQLLSKAIARLRVTDDETNKYWHNRCAIVKAFLCRTARQQANHELEVKMSLDEQNRNPAYCLGRLFAVLENTQRAANPGLNSTIRDRFFASAMATPASVFPYLVRLHQAHLKKLRNTKGGLYHWMEQRRQEVMDCFVGAWPATLTLEQQGLLAMGYDHQRTHMAKPKDKEVNTPATQAE